MEKIKYVLIAIGDCAMYEETFIVDINATKEEIKKAAKDCWAKLSKEMIEEGEMEEGESFSISYQESIFN